MDGLRNIINGLARELQSSGSRSDVLNPLRWFIGFITFAIVVVAVYGMPAAGNVQESLILYLMVLLFIAASVYLGCYIFFAIRDPDSLRSERFKLNKMVIEQRIYGDSETGYKEINADVSKPIGIVKNSLKIEGEK